MIELALAGTPSSGKSTFFKAATLKDAKIAPYPFTTIEPNEGTAHVAVRCPCLQLVKAVKTIMKNGLQLLMIEAPDKM